MTLCRYLELPPTPSLGKLRSLGEHAEHNQDSELRALRYLPPEGNRLTIAFNTIFSAKHRDIESSPPLSPGRLGSLSQSVERN